MPSKKSFVLWSREELGYFSPAFRGPLEPSGVAWGIFRNLAISLPNSQPTSVGSLPLAPLYKAGTTEFCAFLLIEHFKP